MNNHINTERLHFVGDDSQKMAEMQHLVETGQESSVFRDEMGAELCVDVNMSCTVESASSVAYRVRVVVRQMFMPFSSFYTCFSFHIFKMHHYCFHTSVNHTINS